MPLLDPSSLSEMCNAINDAVMFGGRLPAVERVSAATFIASRIGKPGAGYAYMQMLRLPFSLTDIFTEWLRTHFPDRAEKVLNRIRGMRGGKLNSSHFGKRMTGEGTFAEQIHQLFVSARKKAGLREHAPRLSTAAFHRPGGQMQLF